MSRGRVVVQPAASDWWALVGPMAGPEPAGWLTTPHDAFRVLTAPISVGPLHLRAGDHQLVEYSARLDLGWAEAVSWPIVVTGSFGDLRQASREIHRLCCLLSLAWFEAWQVRVAPRLVSQGAPHVPDPILVPAEASPVSNPQVGKKDPLEVPDWLWKAWERLDEPIFGAKCSPCISFWHEGIILQAEHPSLAFLAYVASVEQTASLIEPKPKGHYEDQFWAAISAFAPPEAMSMLRSIDLYDTRSKTGHGRGLFGIESEYGYMLLPPRAGPGDPVFDFVFGDLPQMARVSRDVLLRAIRP